MDITYQFNQNKEIISLLEKTFEEFRKDHPISITFSDELPPIFLKNSEFVGQEKKEELIHYPIDELMGAYDSKARDIVIYLQGINHAVKLLTKINSDINHYKNILMLVILHELGHYWFHNFPIATKEPNEWIEDTVLNEWIAQMFVFLCIINEEELKNTMETLSRYQSCEYRIYKHFNKLSGKQFKNVVKKIRNAESKKKDYKTIEEYEHVEAFYKACIYNL